MTVSPVQGGGQPELAEVMDELRASLLHVLWLEGDTSAPQPSVTVQGGVGAFSQALRAAGSPMAFTQVLRLSEDNFTIDLGEDEDEPVNSVILVDRPLMQPFRSYIGEPWFLRAFFLHAGFRIEAVWLAPWWDAFSAALDEAYAERERDIEAQSAAAMTEMRQTSARMIEALRARLPRDEAFIALACESRPRITAMRHRAMKVLEEELGIGYITSSEDPTLRELAARVREEHRRRR